MNGILVSVDYGDILSHTLPHNIHHFDKLMVVTSSKDKETQAIVKQNKAELFVTDSFYKDRATFNKWRALEEGLDALGRKGWLAIMDADIIWPKRIRKNFRKGNLYSPWRRIWRDVELPLLHEDEWENHPRHNDISFAGYTLIFHCQDRHLPKKPWHEINWAHAGGADTIFQKRWPEANKKRTGWDVLHLGPPCKNWCGRSTARLDGRLVPHSGNRSRMLKEFMRLRSMERRMQGDKYRHERIRIKDNHE